MKWLKCLLKKKQVEDAPTKQLNIPVVMQQSEQLKCVHKKQYIIDEEGYWCFCTICMREWSAF